MNLEKDIQNYDEAYYQELMKAIKLNKYVWIDTDLWGTDEDKYDSYTFDVYWRYFNDKTLQDIFDRNAEAMKLIQCSGYDLYDAYSMILVMDKLYKLSKINTLEDLESIIKMRVIDTVEDESSVSSDDCYYHEVISFYGFEKQMEICDIKTLGKILIYHGDEGCVPSILAEQLIRIGEYGCVHMG